MNKYIIYCFLVLSAVSLSSCNDDDELLEPSTGIVDNKFAVPADATGPEADLRRQFYADNGTFLMFTDLLSHEYQGKDAYGDDVYKDEYIDFRYNLTSMNDVAPEFVFIDDIESKKEAASLIEDYIFPHLGGKLMPFSILVVESLRVPRYGTYGNLTKGITYSCWRCRAIATGEWLALPDDEKAEYSKSILKAIVSGVFNSLSDEADEFMELSYEHSGEYVTDIYPDWDRSDMSQLYELGYLSYFSWSEDDPYDDEFPTASTDFTNFYNAVMDREEEDFMQEYGGYPKIVTKYNIIRNAILALGYKF